MAFGDLVREENLMSTFPSSGDVSFAWLAEPYSEAAAPLRWGQMHPRGEF